LKKAKPVIPFEREQMICDLADYIGEQYHTDQGTDLDALIEDKGIHIFYEEFEEPLDGLLDLTGRSPYIYCNLSTGNHPGGKRTRFTISHELGHYFIDEHRSALANGFVPSLGEYTVKDLVVEREADLFASRLLMPGAVYSKLAKKSEPGLKGVVELAKRFDVSIKCSAIRYLSEDIFPCALSFWSMEGKLVWKWFSKSMWNAGIRKFNPVPVAKGATDICIYKECENPGHSEYSAASVGYVFQVGDNPHYNEVVHEEAIVLGDYGVLSLIRSQKKKLMPMAEVLDRRYDR
jgi:Zn-dependent peptidase ImmA (M78 family)